VTVNGRLGISNRNSCGVRRLFVGAALIASVMPAAASARPLRPTHHGTTTNVYLMNMSTGDVRLLTHNRESEEDAVAYSPALSPDGTRFVFAETRCHYCSSIVRVAAAGTRGRPGRAIAPGFQPIWTPDGRRIAFVRPNGTIAVTSRGITRPRVLVRGGLANASPRWRPGRAQLAFARQVTASNWQIFTARSDGSGLRPVTRGPRPSVDPAWSPDGRHLAFSQQQPNGRWQVCVTSAAGNLRCIRTGASDTQPSWSPDGRRLAFVRQTGPGSAIWLMRLDGHGARRVPMPDGVVAALQPGWSSDGRLLFVGRLG
jgi:Tol biopolymer transport system component